LDLITLTAAKTALNITVSTYDTELAQQITTISRVIDDLCGPVVVRTITAETHPGGEEFVGLRRWPVSSVTTVREDQGGGTVATLAAVAFGSVSDGYYAPPWPKNPSLLDGRLWRRRYGVPWRWANAVQVTYIAGRAANTAAVDARFAEATAAVLRRYWKREAGAWTQSADVFAALEGGDPGGAFYRAVQHVVGELLFDEIQSRTWGLA
jgi:hypothetical protein